MGFIESYKKLEKLCGEMYNDNHGLSVYIDEMIKAPNGAYYVPKWNEDLKQLKHYRWIRNQIVHEPGCTEENMCDSKDVQWIDSFYSRMMSVSDQLALYRKAQNSQVVQKSKQIGSNEYTYRKYNKRPATKHAGCLTCLSGVLLFAAAVSLIMATL